MFTPSRQHWKGSCGPLFDQTPQFTIGPADSVTTGVWQQGVRPTTVMAGDMTDAGYPNAPIEVEIYAGDSGVIRTEYGWFAVSGFARTPNGLRFEGDRTITGSWTTTTMLEPPFRT